MTSHFTHAKAAMYGENPLCDGRVNQYQTQLENKKKTLGDKLNVVQDYATSNYPTSLQSTVLNTLIRGANAMTEAFKHRDQLLNS